MARRICLPAWTALVVAVLAPAWAGCNLPRPRIFQPRGPIQQQRLEASAYDPYPSEDLGPEMVGVRPREYQQGVPEAVRNQPLGPRPRQSVFGP